MKVQQWIRTPKGYVIAALTAYLVIASIGLQDMTGIIKSIVGVSVSVITDILCCRIAKRKRMMPDGAVITGLILALILSTTTSWSVLAVTAVLSILSKHLLTYRKKPIFNPAALGLLLSVLCFQTGQSWWGAFGDLPAWAILFLLIGGYAVTNRVHKFPQIFSFFGALFLMLLLMGYFNIGDAADALRPPFINAALFFGLIMLTDPPTSPAKVKGQVIFGAVAAVTGTVVYGLFGGLTYLFIGLLAGNLYHLMSTRASAKPSNEVRPAMRKVSTPSS